MELITVKVRKVEQVPVLDEFKEALDRLDEALERLPETELPTFESTGIKR